MMTYSSIVQDSMIRVGDTWVRASQIESIRRKANGVNPRFEDVTVQMISGRKHQDCMAKGEAYKIARKAVGLE